MPTQVELIKGLSLDSNNWYEKYPWFSLGQLIHTSDKIELGDFKSAAQLTAIYFNNVQRLHWLLHEKSFNKNKILNDLMVPVGIESMQNTPQPFPQREHPQVVTAPTHLIAVAAVKEADAIATILNVPKEDILLGDVIIHDSVENLVEGKSIDKIGRNQKFEDVDINKFSKQIAENIQQTKKTKEVGQIVEGASVSSVQMSEPITNTPAPVEDGTKNFIGEKMVGSNNPTIATADGIESVTKAKENIRTVLDGGNALNISFEPYHTIDYFASQGIKVDNKADDRLGKQLKSFTSWLKSMKKLPTNEEAFSEPVIMQVPDKSLDDTNVITEAMASVLFKQGKKEQAIEVFKKLSLLHPEKSRYFAAQIEQIKN